MSISFWKLKVLEEDRRFEVLDRMCKLNKTRKQGRITIDKSVETKWFNSLQTYINNKKKANATIQLQLTQYSELLKKFQHSLFFNETFKHIVDLPVQEITRPAVHVDVPAEEQTTAVIIDSVEKSSGDYSDAQLSRVTKQCTIAADMLRDFIDVRQNILKLNVDTLNAITACRLQHGTQNSSVSDDTTQNDDASLIEKLAALQLTNEQQISPLRDDRLLDNIVSRITQRYNFDSVVLAQASTIRNWWRALKQSDFEGFVADGRGHWVRDFILETLNLKTRFILFMKTAKKVSVDECRAYLIERIAEQLTINPNILEKYSIKIPICRNTAHRWMLMCGASFDATTKCYYTDRHDTTENINYRNNFYLVAHDDLSRRQAVWIWLPLHKVSKEAQKQVRRVLGLTLSDPLPLNEQECIPCHVDFLSETEHAQFRANSLKQDQRPGDYLHELLPDGQFPVWSNFTVCKHRHDKAVCKCNLPIILMGHVVYFRPLMCLIFDHKY
jgi:hypothetical protein